MIEITRPSPITVIYLLSCAGKKQPVPAPAKDLYASPWFRKARRYAESTTQPWFILSAKHDLVHPDEVISPYDCTLSTMAVEHRRQWASRVLTELKPHLYGVGSIVLLAGNTYRQYLEPSLRTHGLEVSVPMKGLRIGEQLRWLNKRVHA